jgi:hypothetical protein
VITWHHHVAPLQEHAIVLHSRSQPCYNISGIFQKEGPVKLKILLVVFSLCAMVIVSLFYLFGTAGAATTSAVSPSVTVNSTLSLTLENTNNVQWGTTGAGTTKTGTIQAVIGANTGWNLTVLATAGYSGTNELTNGSQRIASSNFKYTSAAGIPAPPNGTGVTTANPFDGTNETPVWTTGTAYDGCKVAITYNLQIPANQAPGTYTATHTYTLTSSE